MSKRVLVLFIVLAVLVGLNLIMFQVAFADEEGMKRISKNPKNLLEKKGLRIIEDDKNSERDEAKEKIALTESSSSASSHSKSSSSSSSSSSGSARIVDRDEGDNNKETDAEHPNRSMGFQ